MAHPDLEPDWEVCDPDCKIEFSDDKHDVNYNDGTYEYGDSNEDEIDLEVDGAAHNAEAGAGNDAVYGDEHWNILDGERGQDYIEGKEGNDIIEGGSGNDWLFGGDNDDQTVEVFDDDCIDGEAGCDYIDGELGNDLLLGGQDADVLYGGKGNDIMFGDDGDGN
ncbi:MAG: calcium-binding protein, partial [Henriciella sp.]|uniref:calcium-binding protein n=1 Tax=Henriciella sp. TaxID=1968823 RepID=UPI003C72F461